MDSQPTILQQDEDGKSLVWIVWELTIASQLALRAICTTSESGAARREMILDENHPRTVRVHIEKRWVDHLYGFEGL